MYGWSWWASVMRELDGDLVVMGVTAPSDGPVRRRLQQSGQRAAAWVASSRAGGDRLVAADSSGRRMRLCEAGGVALVHIVRSIANCNQILNFTIVERMTALRIAIIEPSRNTDIVTAAPRRWNNKKRWKFHLWHIYTYHCFVIEFWNV